MNDSNTQKQFLTVIDRDQAEKLFQAELDMIPLESEQVFLSHALYRVLAFDVFAPIDVPGFDRSNVDGFALKAEDSFGACEDSNKEFQVGNENIATGVHPKSIVFNGTTLPISTGGMLPRGADAVVMIENTHFKNGVLYIDKAVSPGSNITFAGTDIAKGEIILRKGELLSSRETGVLAALGINKVSVIRKPRVSIFSTGDEIVPPGESLPLGSIYDSNSTVLADAVREIGCEAIGLGIIKDQMVSLKDALNSALKYDVILLSGGTSKGGGDLSYKAVAEMGAPGIVAHGISLKPGKPLCLAVIRHQGRKVPVVVLPGFPTSAIFTFLEFVAPVLKCMAGKSVDKSSAVSACLPFRINSEQGRTEFLLVGLVRNQSDTLNLDRPKFSAYPLGKGSGSVTSFAKADGYIVIPQNREFLDVNEIVDVQLLAKEIIPAEIVIMGSHCVGLDYLIGKLRELGVRAKFLSVGSTGGLDAVKRNECDIAGIHLLHQESNTYNQHFISDNIELIKGYSRRQGLIFRKDDKRFSHKTLDFIIQNIISLPNVLMVNRNRGSGTRILIDKLLNKIRPDGYFAEVKSHTAVVAAVCQERADWGIAIKSVVEESVLGFIPLTNEEFDFAIPKVRLSRPEIQIFVNLLKDPSVLKELEKLGLLLKK